MEWYSVLELTNPVPPTNHPVRASTREVGPPLVKRTGSQSWRRTVLEHSGGCVGLAGLWCAFRVCAKYSAHVSCGCRLG